MNLDNKKMQAIINKAKFDEEFHYIESRLRWERITDSSYDTIQFYISYVIFSSSGPIVVVRRNFGTPVEWGLKTPVAKESVDNFYYLYIDKNMDFKEIIQRYKRLRKNES